MRILRKFLHPVQSGKSLYRRIDTYVYNKFAEHKLRKIRRREIYKCWCNGDLLPFKWHPGYGVCAQCHCYVNRFPPIDLKELYSFGLYWHTLQKFYGYLPIEERAMAYDEDKRIDAWLQLIKRYCPPSGKVIEVGCAPGILMARLQESGYQCLGVEPDEASAAWMREHMKIDVQAGFFPETELDRCDVFLAFDVLEHSPVPEAFVKKISELLNPGGVAIIQTPIDRYDYQPPFGKAFTSAFKDLEHLFIFTNEAMKQLAERSGLEIVSLSERIFLHHEIAVLRKP